MSGRPTRSVPADIIERAYELARSGTCGNFTAIAKALKKERYEHARIEQHFVGRGIRTQLAEICRASRETAQDADG